MKLLILTFLTLLSVSFTLSVVTATETTENQNDTIQAQCQNKKLISLVSFDSDLLGKGSHIFYNCVSKNIYLSDSREISAPLEFTFEVNNSNLTLLFYPPVAAGQPARSRKIAVDLSENPTITIVDQNQTEKKLFNREGNISHSLQNFPFLQSLVNVPGWETLDPNGDMVNP